MQNDLARINDDVISRLESLTLNWMKMKRVMAMIISAKNQWIKEIKKQTSDKQSKLINVEMLENAATVIFRMIQMKSFLEEVKALSSSTHNPNGVNQSSSLFKLDPFLDSNGVLGVGGRLSRSKLTSNEANPVVLPKTSNITEAVVIWSHAAVGHGGRGLTLNNLRKNGIWVLCANAVVRRIIHKCVTCRKLRGKLGDQKMSDLPKERCCEAAPFTHCGVDMFGPFTIRERRSDLKRYFALFTCFAIRAVHIKVTCTMETDSFIQALRRFIARRGKVRSIRSDNGTNFVGTDSELRKALEEMNQEQIRDYLLQNGTDWITWYKNPLGASHMGGVWERQIQSARNILAALLKTHGQSLKDEGLRTLVAETEAIVNSRPLTVESLSDVNSEIPLSPSNLLTMKSDVIMPPPGVFNRPDLYSRRRWRRGQHIAGEFWSRWRKEFLQSLQARQKWNISKRNFQVGDVVLLKEDIGRNKWPMVRIVSTEPYSCGMLRSVQLKVIDISNNNIKLFRRPISKIVLLVEN